MAWQGNPKLQSKVAKKGGGKRKPVKIRWKNKVKLEKHKSRRNRKK